jgi:pimeloyl-ACP methyl ester carboxylesterase
MRRLAVLVLLGLVFLPAIPASARASASTIAWTPCHQSYGPFECARVSVPLDYDDPGGPHIGLALARLPATEPGARIGTIFLNPGGPGNSGVDMLLHGGPFLFSPGVRARFDLVGFDPRGIRRSTPLQCFSSLDEAAATLAPFPFPVTSDEETVQAAADAMLDAACDANAGLIVDHMATADVARDLDLLRQMVGDDKLTYAGYSYGSYIGVTYANLFPDKVRALVVDGVLDPIAYSTGRAGESELPMSTRVHSDAGAQATLGEFFRLCDEAGPAGCAFAGDSESRFAAMADQVRAEPVEITDPFTGEVFLLTYAELVSFMSESLYDSWDWFLAAQVLAYVEDQISPTPTGRSLLVAAGGMKLDRPAARYPNFVEGGIGVFCSDSDNPDDVSAWSTAGADADAQYGYFGRPWTWLSSPCVGWTGFDDDRYMGPFDAATANPVLVVGNRFDPATRYEGAETVHDLLPNSSLLTVDGWGHTSLFLSRCADRLVSRYLLTGRTPAPGTVCSQDFNPFAAPAAGATDNDLAARAALRRALMSDMASGTREVVVMDTAMQATFAD